MCDVCVSRGKSRATAGQPADVEISDQTNPVQFSPRPGPNPLAAKAQSRRRSRDERDKQTGWLMDGWMMDDVSREGADGMGARREWESSKGQGTGDRVQRAQRGAGCRV